MITPTCPEIFTCGTETAVAPHQTVLVTDATRGVGRKLANEFARLQVALVLVAPETEELRQLAERLRREFRVDVLAIVNDLRGDDAAGEITREVSAAGWELTFIATSVGVFARTT